MPYHTIRINPVDLIEMMIVDCKDFDKKADKWSLRDAEILAKAAQMIKEFNKEIKE